MTGPSGTKLNPCFWYELADDDIKYFWTRDSNKLS